MLKLEHYSMGVGDRFAHQARAQLAALIEGRKLGIDVVPVWNKSFREHDIVHSQPGSVRTAADAAIQALHWQHPYHVDADHIRLGTVDGFIDSSDFFTLDVAEAIGQPADPQRVAAFIARHPELTGSLDIAGIDARLSLDAAGLRAIVGQYLAPVEEAAAIYQRILTRRAPDSFIVEVSMDEVDTPQTPLELLVILALIAEHGIPAQTIAPRFSGRFNKGVDYVGDPAAFEREFRADIAVIAHAVRQYALPKNLKLSVHSGSDKFSIYGPIRRVLAETGAGLHLKTAGTTWLEELIGLAEAGGEGLAVAKTVYREAWHRREALCAPYASVIDIDPDRLPHPDDVDKWAADDYVSALRHIPDAPRYNADLRQLLHVGYKVAAELGERYLSALRANEESIARNVTENILQRHLLRVFPARG
jgi:tagaturonate epimerase